MKNFYLLVILLCSNWAFATNKKPTPPPPVETSAETNVEASSYATVDQNQEVYAVGTGYGGAATNAGNNLSVNSTYERAAPNVILVPNNNTESCLRVFGLSFSNTQGGGGLGIPFRSKSCDREQAAQDAFDQGQYGLGWFWKCENKSLYKTFQAKGESVESAKADCLARMADTVTKENLTKRLQQDNQRLQQQVSQLQEARREDYLQCESEKDKLETVGCK